MTDFLIANVEDGFAESPADWETAFEGFSSSLADLPPTTASP